MALENNTRSGRRGATASSELRQAGASPEARLQPPVVQLVGEIDHPDFREAIEFLGSESRLSTSLETCPEVIIVVQSRPDVFDGEYINQLQRAAPLAGTVALLGSWCEGET